MRDTKPTQARKVTKLPKLPPAAMLRTLLLAALAFFACVYAIVHFATRQRPPIVVPPVDSQELPAPDIVPND